MMGLRGYRIWRHFVQPLLDDLTNIVHRVGHVISHYEAQPDAAFDAIGPACPFVPFPSSTRRARTHSVNGARSTRKRGREPKPISHFITLTRTSRCRGLWLPGDADGWHRSN